MKEKNQYIYNITLAQFDSRGIFNLTPKIRSGSNPSVKTGSDQKAEAATPVDITGTEYEAVMPEFGSTLVSFGCGTNSLRVGQRRIQGGGCRYKVKKCEKL